MNAARAPAAPPATAADALRGVRGYLDAREHLVVGLMTGTSADAVDAALVRFTGLGLASTHTLVAYRESPLEDALRREILEVAAAGTLAPERLMRLDAALGERYAAAVLELVAEAGVALAEVDAIGCHGQTVRHLPRGDGAAGALTLQIGSADILAERTGVTVVSGFRPRDTAAGGEGAPLVPLVDWWLFRSADQSRVLLNLGGIANLTYLPRDGSLADLLAFDTGPCNAVLDALAARLSVASSAATMGEPVRAASRVAAPARGPARRPVLRPHPAALDRARALRRRLRRHTRREGAHTRGHRRRSDGDRGRAGRGRGLDAVSGFISPRGGVDAVYASGGGVKNPSLMASLARARPPRASIPADALGVSPDAKEALAFAFLAHQTLCGGTRQRAGSHRRRAPQAARPRDAGEDPVSRIHRAPPAIATLALLAWLAGCAPVPQVAPAAVPPSGTPAATPAATPHARPPRRLHPRRPLPLRTAKRRRWTASRGSRSDSGWT